MRISIIFACTAWVFVLAGRPLPSFAQASGGKAPASGAAESAGIADIEVQEQAVFALSRLPGAESAARLLEVARTHSRPEIRKQAIFWLGQRGDAETLDELATIARNDPDGDVQEQVLFAYAQLPADESVPRLIAVARSHPEPEVRGQAIFWLGRKGGPAVLAFFDELMRQPGAGEVHDQVVFAYAQLPASEGVPRLIDLARTHPNADVRKGAIFWLGQSGDARATAALMDMLQGN